jgi:hypothetical protein
MVLRKERIGTRFFDQDGELGAIAWDSEAVEHW